MGKRNSLPLVETRMPLLALLDQISRDADDAWPKPSTTSINVDQAETENSNANLNAVVSELRSIGVLVLSSRWLYADGFMGRWGSIRASIVLAIV